MKFYGEELQPPSSVPMLFPDLMIAAYMKDVDLGLMRQPLQHSVSERSERFNRLVNGAYPLRWTSVKKARQSGNRFFFEPAKKPGSRRRDPGLRLLPHWCRLGGSPVPFW
jgi:hypothetical protein